MKILKSCKLFRDENDKVNINIDNIANNPEENINAIDEDIDIKENVGSGFSKVNSASLLIIIMLTLYDFLQDFLETL